MLDVQMDGGKELEDSLLELAKIYGPKSVSAVFNAPIKKAMGGMLTDVQSNTPVDSGDLKESVALKVGKPSKSRLRNSQTIDETVASQGRVGWFWSKGSGVNSHAALSVEFGTQTTGAQPVLRKALQTGAGGAVQILKKEVGRSLDKTANRLAKKRAKGLI